MNVADTLKKLQRLMAGHRRLRNPPDCADGHFGCSCTSEDGGPCSADVADQIDALSSSDKQVNHD